MPSVVNTQQLSHMSEVLCRPAINASSVIWYDHKCFYVHFLLNQKQKNIARKKSKVWWLMLCSLLQCLSLPEDAHISSCTVRVSKPTQWRLNWILIVGNPCAPALYEIVVKRQSMLHCPHVLQLIHWAPLSSSSSSSGWITQPLKKANHHHQDVRAKLRSFFENLSTLQPHQREDTL